MFLGIIHDNPHMNKLLYFQRKNSTGSCSAGGDRLVPGLNSRRLAWKRLRFSRDLPLSALFLYHHQNSTFFPIISVQQLLPRTSRSSVIATGQGATQLRTLLSFLHSRLLIPRGPDDSPSISAGFFSCVGWEDAAKPTGGGCE